MNLATVTSCQAVGMPKKRPTEHYSGYSRHSADLPREVAEYARGVVAKEKDVKLVDVSRALFAEFKEDPALRERVLERARAERKAMSAEIGERLTRARLDGPKGGSS